MVKKALFITFLSGAAVLAQPVVMIDDFTSGFYDITADQGTPNIEAVRAGGGILGGERDAMLMWLSGPQAVNAMVTAEGVQFFNGHSQTVGSLFLQYDGLDGEIEGDGFQTMGGGLGADLSGENAFLLDFRFVNGGLGSDISVNITVTDGSGSVSHLVNVSEGSNVLSNVSFAQFAGIDFADVRRLDFQFTGQSAMDFTLQSIQAVPEPATLMALGAGALGLMARRRRKNS